jgi:hypothetical protein
LNREATVLLRGLVDPDAAQAVLSQLPVPIELRDNGIIVPLVTGLRDLSEIHAYHLAPPGIGKADAVAYDLARRGLSRHRAAAIGDSVSDVGMGEAVSMVAMVSNALEDERVGGAARSRSNIYALRGKRGDGWAEFADAWIAARADR